MKILMIGTFPIASPRHGGQLRADALFRHYNDAGHEVRYCGISIIDWYKTKGPDDITIDVTGMEVPLLGSAPELAIGRLIYDDDDTRKKLERLISEFAPEVIQFEQPYTYSGVKEILYEMDWQGKLIHSSYNIETELKKDMLDSPERDEDVQSILAEVRQIETDLTQIADLTIACTESDAVELRRMGAKKTLVAMNATTKLELKQDNLKKWKARLQKDGIKNTVLFIGSAHRPNMTGFRDLVGYALGYVPSDTRIIIVGGVGDLIKQDLKRSVLPHVAATFSMRALLLGKVRTDDLASLLRLADTIILPITQGGGSNLKTAEAIMANKKIVATRKAFRSFEVFMNIPNVIFADSSTSFKKAILRSINMTKEDRTKTQLLLGDVTWERALKNLAQEVNAL